MTNRFEQPGSPEKEKVEGPEEDTREQDPERAREMAKAADELETGAAFARRIGREEKATEFSKEAADRSEQAGEEYDREQAQEVIRQEIEAAKRIRFEQTQREQEEQFKAEVDKRVDMVLDLMRTEKGTGVTLIEKAPVTIQRMIDEIYKRLELSEVRKATEPTVHTYDPPPYPTNTRYPVRFESYEVPTKFGVVLRERHDIDDLNQESVSLHASKRVEQDESSA